MKLLITGCEGFIGRNLVSHLEQVGVDTLFLCGRQTTGAALKEYLIRCDFIIHLAGVNRPSNPLEFEEVHRDFTAEMIRQLEENGNRCPILAASSIQASSDTPYGKSKQMMEELLLSHNRLTGAPVIIYRLPNVFGKWCRPFYNSVVATFCWQIARGERIHADEKNPVLRLAYIDDVVGEFIKNIRTLPKSGSFDFRSIPDTYSLSIKELAETLQKFHRARATLTLPPLEALFNRKLYATYLSYLPEGGFHYFPEIKSDARGFFCEMLKSDSFGQLSVSRTKPGIVRGNHWHHTKHEKFIVVEGEGVIRFRNIEGSEITSYPVSGQIPQVVEVPPGYTHTLENTGASDMVTLIWCSESFDAENPDTYSMEV